MSNVCVTGVLEGIEGRNGLEDIFGEIVAKSPNLEKYRYFQAHEAHRTPDRYDQKNSR